MQNILKNLSFIKLKYYTLIILTIFTTLFTSLIIFEEYSQFQKDIKVFEKQYLKDQKELIRKETLRAIKYIEYKYKKEFGKKSLEEIKEEIVDAIEQMRNERDGTGYIFIYTFEGVNIADPILKQNAGKNLIDFTDPNGKKVIKELIEVSKRPNGGYVEYVWNKPIENILAPKISYAKAFKPLKWMVGTGVYLDEIEKIVKKKKEQHRDKMIKYIINIATLSFILFGIVLAISRYISTLIEGSLNRLRTRFIYASKNNSYIYTQDLLFNEFKEIASYANKMIKTIKKRTKKLKELNLTLEEKVKEKTKKLRLKNQELEASKNFTENLLQAQEKFIKTAIHEINTPLSIILANIDLLKMEGIDKKEITKIESGVKIIHNIYNDLSYMVKKDIIEYKKETIDFSQVLKERIEFFDEVAKGNLLDFDISIQDDCKVFFNKTELQRIIDNNLSNAIKYSFPYSKIYINLSKKDIFIEFCIKTNSKKIEEPGKIFDSYYREHSARGGFGLGLALVKEICDKNSVMIEVESNEKTTYFKYRFKRQK
ncbi:cache domain-containing protein [Nitrosophilus alvini]|uniref:sensor histidine kinase n=1 Tax=Nitrosophilus alvini TaxID=2714855 RepID=UPI00190DDAB9|nr:cache domain-containing protein [Nitrosophilus alvini]